MSRETDRKRTVEARLDSLRRRLQPDKPRDIHNLVGVLKGTLDLLSDVLLEDEGR